MYVVVVVVVVDHVYDVDIPSDRVAKHFPACR